MISTILLDQRDRYLVDGKLPHRPDYDKALLALMLSEFSLEMEELVDLPRSLQRANYTTFAPYAGYTSVKIPRIAESALLLVSRTEDRGELSENDRMFRLDEHMRLNVEVWIRKDVLRAIQEKVR